MMFVKSYSPKAGRNRMDVFLDNEELNRAGVQ
jgi:hypothetical protein